MKGKAKLFGVCRTRWVSRTDRLNILIYIVQASEYSCLSPDSNLNRDTVAKARVLLNYVINFDFIVTLVMTKKYLIIHIL